MRTMIFGAKGQLGQDLLRVFAHTGETRGYDLPEVDISDETALQPVVHEFAPDLILNAAGFSQVEDAESHLEEAFLANETGARNVAELAAYHGIPVVYYSSSMIFGDREEPWKPGDAICPDTAYGRSKAAGEVATRRANSRHFIVRCGWLYGPGGRNYVETMLRSEADSVLEIDDSELGSTMYSLDLAEATLGLVRTHAFGIYHASNEGACTRYDFAREVVRLGELAVTVCALPKEPGKERCRVLDTSALDGVLGYTARPWREALAEYMHRRGAAKR